MVAPKGNVATRSPTKWTLVDDRLGPSARGGASGWTSNHGRSRIGSELVPAVDSTVAVFAIGTVERFGKGILSPVR